VTVGLESMNFADAFAEDERYLQTQSGRLSLHLQQLFDLLQGKYCELRRNDESLNQK